MFRELYFRPISGKISDQNITGCVDSLEATYENDLEDRLILSSFLPENLSKKCITHLDIFFNSSPKPSSPRRKQSIGMAHHLSSSCRGRHAGNWCHHCNVSGWVYLNQFHLVFAILLRKKSDCKSFEYSSIFSRSNNTIIVESCWQFSSC